MLINSGPSQDPACNYLALEMTNSLTWMQSGNASARSLDNSTAERGQPLRYGVVSGHQQSVNLDS